MTTTQTISLDSLSDLRLNKEDRTLTLEFSAAPVSQESSVRKVGTSIIVTRNGKEKLLVDAVREEFGIPKTVNTAQAPLAATFQGIRLRLAKGMTFDQALTDYNKGGRALMVDYQGKTLRFAHALKVHLGIPVSVSYASSHALKATYEGVKKRINLGMSFDEAIADYSIRNSATIQRAKRESKAA